MGRLTGSLQSPPSAKAERLTPLTGSADSTLTPLVGFVIPSRPWSSVHISTELLKLCGVPTKPMLIGSAVTPHIRKAILMSPLLSLAHLNPILPLLEAQKCSGAPSATDLASLLSQAILVA